MMVIFLVLLASIFLKSIVDLIIFMRIFIRNLLQLILQLYILQGRIRPFSQINQLPQPRLQVFLPLIISLPLLTLLQRMLMPYRDHIMLHIMNSLRLMIPGLEIAILLFQLLELFVRVLIWSHPGGLVEVLPVV